MVNESELTRKLIDRIQQYSDRLFAINPVIALKTFSKEVKEMQEWFGR